MFENFFKQDVSNLNSIGQFIELYRQINVAIKKQGADPDKTAKELIKGNIVGKAVESYLIEKSKEVKTPTQKSPFKNDYCKELFSEQEIFIDACGGTVESGFTGNQTLFPAYFSSNVKDWDLEKKQKKRGKIKVKVFQQIKDATFSTMFLSLNKDKERLVMTQAQIVEFCKNHKDKLRKDGWGTFFVFKENGKFFVAHVSVNSDGRLGLNVNDFFNSFVWDAELAVHLVVPATALKS